MKNPLGVSPSKGYQGTTRGKEKILMTSVGIEPTTSGLDLPLLCRLSYMTIYNIHDNTRLMYAHFSRQENYISCSQAVLILVST